jgi:hypothetical protein
VLAFQVHIMSNWTSDLSFISLISSPLHSATVKPSKTMPPLYSWWIYSCCTATSWIAVSKTHYVPCTGRCKTMSDTDQTFQHATSMLVGICKKAVKGCRFGSGENSRQHAAGIPAVAAASQGTVCKGDPLTGVSLGFVSCCPWGIFNIFYWRTKKNPPLGFICISLTVCVIHPD